MFQNASEMLKHEELNEKIYNTLYRVKQIFRYQNLIIYFITFLISTLSIKGEFSPFGLAIMAACVGETIPLIGVYIMAVTGTAIGSGLTGAGEFLIISIIYFILVLLFKTNVAIEERNEMMKTGGKIFAATLIFSIVKSFVNVFLLYDVFMGIISSALIYVFYKIFVNGLNFIKEFGVKEAFALEELIAGAIIISLASLAFNSLNIFSLNISNIIIIFMIMVLGWKNGMIIGTVSGVSIGLSICFVNGTSLVQISMFAISGIISGALNKFGKIGVIIGFLLGNAILTYWVRGATTMVIYFREIFVASIGLLFVPNRVKIDVEDLFGKDKLLSDRGEWRLEKGNEEVSEKLKTISNMFNELSTPQNKDEISENILQDFLNNIEEVKANMFYDEISNENNGIAKDICAVLIKNDIIVDKDLVEILGSHNNYVVMNDSNIKNDLQEIIKIANRTFKIYEINKAKKQEREKNIEAINEGLKSATKVIDKCAKEIKSKNVFEVKEQEIQLLLKARNIDVQACKIKKLKNGKYVINMSFDYCTSKMNVAENVDIISDCVSKSLRTKLVFQREIIDDENKKFNQIYSSQDKYILQVGSSKITKDNSEISGDSSLQIKLADGKYLLAIADGMGSGKKARECSKITLRLMKQMLSAGFDKEESISMINARLSLIGNTEHYSSLDTTILDLYAGKIEVLKNGACNTYIKNKNIVKKIKSENLPIGIINNIKLQEENFDVSDGDIIVMCTDGVVDSKEGSNEEWIENFLKDITTTNVQKIADLIIAEAVDNGYGNVKDDMTVIVSKIMKRK